MTKSFYGMIYRGGIALPMGIANVKFLMQHNADIELLERFNSQDAYIWATQTYVERKNQYQRYIMPIIPNMEDLMYKAYHEPNFVESVPTNRFFAVITEGYVGIFTGVESVSDFLAYFHPTMLKEFTNIDDAKWYVNWFFLRRIFPRIAYICTPIQYLNDVPLDMAVPVNFLGSNPANNFPSGMEPTYPELMPPSPVS
ncbi:MAG: hypothetical protein IJG33_02535 [Selenomonadaceae bacterium]|nr:hypothetical protein [Selenomonadaceae bacterium]